MIFYNKLCEILGKCPDANIVALAVLALCILSGMAVGITGVLAWQEVAHKRKKGAE